MSDFEGIGFAVGIDAELERFEANMQRAGRLVETTAVGMDKATRRAAQQFNRLEAALDPTARAAQRLERDTAKVSNALDRGVISSQRAAQTQRRLNNQYEATIARLNGVTAASTRSSAAVARGSRRLSAATSAHRRMGLAAQNAAFQVGDFAVQVASGTAASRAFAQQAPQLLGAFGLFGAVAGAAVAVGAALAPVLISAGDASDEAGKAMDDYRESVSRASRASRDLEAQSRSLAQAKKDETVAFLEAGLAVEQETLSRLNARMRVLQEQQRAGITERAGFQVSDLIDLTGGEMDDVLSAIDSLNNRLAVLRDTLGTTSADTKDFAEEQREAARAANEAERALAAVADRTRDLRMETGVATGALSEIDAELITTEDRLRAAGVSGARLEMALVDLRFALEEQELATGAAAKAIEDFDAKMADLAQQTQVLRGAMTASEAAAADMRRALEDAGVGVEEATERAEAFKEALDLKEAAETASRQLEEYEKGVARVTAINNAVVVPISTQIVGSMPSLFGLGRAPAGAAGGGGGGLLGAGGDLLGIGRGLFGGGAGGFMNTPIFSSLPSGFVGPPAAGQVFTIGTALGGLGIGAGVGGLVSGLTGGNSLAGTGLGAGLGLVGTAIGGPIGGIVGGAVGGLLGGLFGPGKSVGPNALAGIDMQDGMFLGLPGAANNGGSAAAAAEAAQGLADALNILVAMTGATPTGWLPGGVFLGDFPSKGGAHVSVGNPRTLAGLEAIYGPASADPHSGPRGNIAFFLGEQTTAAAVQAALLQTELEGLSEGFETIIASVTRTRMSLEEIEQAFAFGQVYDAVVAAERPLSSFQAAMESLVESFEDGLRRAADLSLSTEDFAAGTRTTFDRDTRDAILQITDPLAFAMEAYERDARARLEAAIKIGADITQVEELIGLERAAIIEQAAGASFAGLRESIDRALSGDAVGGLSPLSPRQRLEEAQREFDRLIDLALAGDAEAAQQATRQRAVLLDMADGVYASSSDFADVFAESGAALESLKGAFNDVAAVGESTSDFIARLLAEIDAAGVAPIVLPEPVPLPAAVTERTLPPPPPPELTHRELRDFPASSAGFRAAVEAGFRGGYLQFLRAVDARAMGGPIMAGQPYWVGEEGPELVVPQRDGFVVPARESEQLVMRAAAAERIGMASLAAGNSAGPWPSGAGDREAATEVRQLRQDLRAVAGGLLEIAEEGVRQGGEQARTGQRMLRQLQGINRNLIERG